MDSLNERTSCPMVLESPDYSYTVIPDGACLDPRLSYQARGLLHEILSRGPGWVISVDSLAGESDGRKTAVISALSELRYFNYIAVQGRAGGADA